MLHKNMIEKKSGFRTLDAGEITAVGGGLGSGFDDGGEGPGIIVTGQREDIWTFEVYPEDWLTLGLSAEEYIFGDRLNTPDPLSDHGDGGGNVMPVMDNNFNLTEAEREKILQKDQDSELQEDIERYLEDLFTSPTEGSPQWTFEYHSSDKTYKGLSSDGQTRNFPEAAVNQHIFG